MQYFLGNGPLGARNVTKVISNVVAGLLENPARRFTYVEQAFFQVWYETQTPSLQQQVSQPWILEECMEYDVHRSTIS